MWCIKVDEEIYIPYEETSLKRQADPMMRGMQILY